MGAPVFCPIGKYCVVIKRESADPCRAKSPVWQDVHFTERQTAGNFLLYGTEPVRYNNIRYFNSAEEKRYLIYIFTALYHEAHSLISYYNLKRDTANPRFQVFSSEDDGICLTVTGVGEIAAAVAVAGICTGRQPERGDFLINIGTCAAGAAEKIQAAGNTGESGGNRKLRGQMFLCNQLIELETGRTFYPDMLYRHDFAEGCVITGRNLWMSQTGAEKSVCGMRGRKYMEAAVSGDGEESVCGTRGRKYMESAVSGNGAEIRDLSDGLQQVLYDMEAAAVYQAGAYFFAPHQMSFLKIVSDNGDADGVSPEQIECLMEENRKNIVSYIETLRRVGEEERELKNRMTFSMDKQGEAGNKPDMLEKLCADLHCSAVMRASVQQHFRYLALSGVDYDGKIRQMYEDGRLPCRDKREGKVRFEELKRELL